MEQDQRHFLISDAKCRRVVAPRHRLQAEHVLVVVDRLLKAADLKAHRSHLGSIGQPESWRHDPVGEVRHAAEGLKAPPKKAMEVSTKSGADSPKTGPCPPFGTTQSHERGIAWLSSKPSDTG